MSRSRRSFLRTLAGSTALAAAWPERLHALSRHLAGLGEQDEEGFWGLVREQFMIPDDRLFLNPATLGPQPRVVVDAVVDHTRRTARTYPPHTDWDALKERTGKFIGADPAGLVFPRNTTEAMNFVANGLELGPDDEVLTTNHEHIGGLCCWQLAAARRGVGLRQLPLPVPATSKDDLVAMFRDAVTARTRVISVSHVTFTNGTLMPVPEIVRLCRERGLVCVVDGAHPPGMMRVEMEALGPPDFYASSPHKWLGAPQGTGLLWMAEPWRTRLWPSVASGGWDDASLGAQRLNHLGTMDESRLAGLDAALGFQEVVGIDRIERRNRQLRKRLYEAVSELPGVTVASPADETLVAGMVSFSLRGIASLELQKRLAQKANVRTRVVSEYDYGWMRLSPHIYNTPEEIDRVVRLIRGEVA